MKFFTSSEIKKKGAHYAIAAKPHVFFKSSNFRLEVGAGEEIRTLDIFLGKEVLYQLSYARINEAQTLGLPVNGTQGVFGKNIRLRHVPLN